MTDRISDEAFEAMLLSEQLELFALHLRSIDEASLREISNEDISAMLMYSIVMARHASGVEHVIQALEQEMAQYRDDDRSAILRLETAFEQAEEPDSNVMGWPVIARNVRENVHGTNTPKGAA